MNNYITRQDFHNWINDDTVNASDDSVIDSIIGQASRFIDVYTSRFFYPLTATYLYDTPEMITRATDCLDLKRDLLEVLTLTNGDATVITSSQYVLREYGVTPYWRIQLKDSSEIIFEPDSLGSHEQVISLSAIWGFHDRYAYAWKKVTKLASSANSSVTNIDVGSISDLSIGSIIKVGTEVMNVTGTTAAVYPNNAYVTVDFRGDNGSTAASHLENDSLYVWQVIDPIKQACYLITNHLYHSRHGENVESIAQVTAAGIVLSPSDIPSTALRILAPYRRLS